MVSEHPRVLCLTLGLLLLAPLGASYAQVAQSSPQQPAAAQLPESPLKQVIAEGTRFFTTRRIADMLGLHVGERLQEPPAQLADALLRRYRDAGYRFARVQSRFEEQSGQLTFVVDEGKFDAVEFTGLPDPLAQRFRDEFALQPGDVFRQKEADRSLDGLLAPTDGAISRSYDVARHRDRGFTSGPYSMTDIDGKRVLEVHLRQRHGDFKFSTSTHGREDWFNPVDGLTPSVGFNQTIFSPDTFNQAYITGYLSYKFGRDRGGYSFGFERSFLARHLFFGAEIHDETGTDDLWRLSILEQSLASIVVRQSFRDYYERHGYQVNGSMRFGSTQELMLGWRDEREQPLLNQSNYSVFRGDREWRANGAAVDGRLQSILFGYTIDTRGLNREPRAERYERHQMASMFGTTPTESERRSGWRVEWTSEFAEPGALGGDFDFRRHILNVRRYNQLTPHDSLNIRVIGGFSEGAVPPQRLFALGGVGTVPGFLFKEAIGEGMVLANVEYEYKTRHVSPLLLYDAGRVFRPVGSSRSDWMQSIGGGLALGEDFRVEVMWPLDRERSGQVLLRFNRPF